MFGRKIRPYITDPLLDGRIPRDHVVQDPAWAVFAEQAARMDEAVAVLKAALKAEMRAEVTPGEVWVHFEDACLDAMLALKPSPAEPPVRGAVPASPGRAS